MIKLSKIKEAKRTKGRYHLYEEKNGSETYIGTVSEETLIRHNLIRARELSEEEFESIKSMETVDRAVQLAVNFISFRMRSEREIISYLKKKETEEDVIPEVLERLEQLSLIDDRAFAQAFVRTRRDTSTKGPMHIRQELYQKGVEGALIDEAMEEFGEDEVLEAAVRLATKKAGEYRRESKINRKNKLMQLLMRKGYQTGIASVAVERVLSEQEEEEDGETDEEWENAVFHGEKLLARITEHDPAKRKDRLKKGLYRKGFPMPVIQRFIDEYVSES